MLYAGIGVLQTLLDVVKGLAGLLLKSRVQGSRTVDTHGPPEVDHPVDNGYLTDVLKLHHIWADEKLGHGHCYNF